MLHDHHIPADRALVALGGNPCRCLQVLEAWQDRNRAKLPAALRPALDAAEEKRKDRFGRWRADALLVPIRHRAEARVKQTARRALMSCDYRRSQSSWAGGEHFVSVFIGSMPDIWGRSDRVWSDNGKWSGNNSYVAARVPLSWYRQVYCRDLDVIDGCFVLDIIAEDDKEVVVLAGKQGRGFKVHPRLAKIITAKDGTRRLRWLKEKEEKR